MREQPFFTHLFDSYFIAFGVLIGGALIGALGAFLTGKPLMTEIFRISSSIRIWAIVTAIGGTFDAISSFERGLFEGDTKDIFKTFLLILAALGGAQTGAALITWLTQEHISQ
jgi:Sporulation protein YtrH